MSLLQLFVLALVQGITEFLPISSSGHLILVPTLTGWPDQGYVMDVAVHVGTLVAVMTYFKRDTKGLALAGLSSIGITPARRAVEGTIYIRMFWALIIATIPTIIVGGLFVATGFIDLLRSPTIIASSSIIFGVLLLWIDRVSVQEKDISQIGIKSALTFGIAQVLALIPGTSRSGITLTAGRALGFTRIEAARFAMLMSIPVIIASGTVAVFKIMGQSALVPWSDAIIAAALACISAFAAIHILMKWLERFDTTVFVYYRVALGIALFIMIGFDII